MTHLVVVKDELPPLRIRVRHPGVRSRALGSAYLDSWAEGCERYRRVVERFFRAYAAHQATVCVG